MPKRKSIFKLSKLTPLENWVLAQNGYIRGKSAEKLREGKTYKEPPCTIYGQNSIVSGWEWYIEKPTTININIKNKIKKPHPQNGVCPYCRTNKPVSRHHIIPRRCGGEDSKNNLINLCYKCHDFVELNTDDWIHAGNPISVEALRTIIINHGWGDPE